MRLQVIDPLKTRRVAVRRSRVSGVGYGMTLSDCKVLRSSSLSLSLSLCLCLSQGAALCAVRRVFLLFLSLHLLCLLLSVSLSLCLSVSLSVLSLSVGDRLQRGVWSGRACGSASWLGDHRRLGYRCRLQGDTGW